MPDLPAPVFTIDLLRDYLLVGAALFALGMLGFLSRRNLIVMFLSAEMMLQGTALSLVAFGRYHGNWTGQVFTIVILTVAACEAAIAMALVVILYNRRSSLDVTLWRDIREPTVAVPTIPTTIPAAWFANVAASRILAPVDKASASVPTTVSPAPVTSYTCLALVGICQ